MEVIINGVQAQLGNSSPAITKKSIDINNPSDRFVDFTNKFQLPYVQQNIDIFEAANLVSSNNRSHDKLYTVEIRDVFQIFKGVGFLESSDLNGFSFQVIDSSKDLFNALNVKLNSISWDDKDTILTQAAIDAQDSVDINNCWFWGKACYHNQALQINTDQTTGDDRTKYSRPSFYLQGLVNRAIYQQGYTFISPIPDMAISSNHKQFFFTSYQKTINATFNPAGTLAITDFTSYDYKYSAVNVTTTSVKCFRKFAVRMRGHITTDAEIYLLIHAVDQTTTKTVDAKYLLPRDGDIDISTSEVYDGPTGMTVTWTLSGTGEVIFSNVLTYLSLNENTVDLSTNPWLDFKIKVHDNLPDNITYLDLLKTICILTNKYFIVNALTKTLSFGSMAELNKLNTVDWSDKFVQSGWSVSSDFSGLAKKNYLRYSNDITVLPELGEDYFETDNDRLPDDIDYIKMAFGASKDVVVNSNEVSQVSIYQDASRISDQEISMRIFAINADKLQFTPLSWVNLKLNYYNNWLNSLRRIRVIDCEVNLNKLDFLSWNPKQLVYIDYFKTTFVVLELSNFIPGSLTKVKLLNYGR